MTEDENKIVLKVGAGSDARKVGSAIAHSVNKGKEVSLRSVGAGATNQAIKAVAIATTWTAPRGLDLTVRPSFLDIDGKAGDTISAVVLAVVVGGR